MTRLRGWLAAVLLSTANPALAWNNQGHMATGTIAYDTLARSNPETIATIVAIMRAHPDHARFERALGSLAGPARDRRLFALMARWPDDIRKTAYDRPDWHYAAKIVSGWTLFAPFTAGKAIDQFASQLALARDAGATPAARAIALCWVFHITGDMHEPLHAGHSMTWRFPLTDRLGTIAWVRAPDGRPVSLHEFWDSGADLPGAETAAAEALAQRSEHLIGPAAKPLSATAAVQFATWVAQSRALAAIMVYRGAVLDASDNPATAPLLPASYVEATRTLSERRIGEGGQHIATVVSHLKPAAAAIR